jgi:hypothetical protein
MSNPLMALQRDSRTAPQRARHGDPGNKFI